MTAEDKITLTGALGFLRGYFIDAPASYRKLKDGELRAAELIEQARAIVRSQKVETE